MLIDRLALNPSAGLSLLLRPVISHLFGKGEIAVES